MINVAAGLGLGNLPIFNPIHQHYLKSRAVPPEIAASFGLRSVDATTAGLLLKRSDLKHGGLVIPFQNTDPTYHRIRMDEGDPKELAPAGREVPVFATIEPSALPKEFFVVESAIKAIALFAHGLLAFGLSGVATTLAKSQEPRLNGSWLPFDLKEKTAVIIFDSDRGLNPRVAIAEARLAIALEKAGASVLIAALPHGHNGEPRGPDDFIAERGAEALMDIIKARRWADPVKMIESLGEKPHKLLDDRPFLIATMEQGQAAIVSVREAARKHGITKTDLDRSLRDTASWVKAERIRSAHQDPGESRINVINGSLCDVRDGHVERLCNFTARIERERVLDDGVQQQRRYVIGGRTSDGAVLPSIEVLPEEFHRDGAWIQKGWGQKAIIEARAGTQNRLRYAIQAISSPIEEHVFIHTGWARMGGGWGYVHANGIIGSSVATVHLDAGLSDYALPAPDEDRIPDAIRASTDLVDVAPHRVTVPLLSATFLAVLTSFVRPDFMIWIDGKTGSRKSTLAALFMNHFGEAFAHNRLPASWRDTHAAIEAKLFSAKDTLMVIDNFLPESGLPRDPVRTMAERVIHSIGDQRARSRMRHDMTARMDLPPRSLALSTGEDAPSQQSALGRMVLLRLSPTEVDNKRLTEAQGKRSLLALAMRSFIEFISADPERHGRDLRARAQELRSAYEGKGHARTPAALALLHAAGELFAGFAFIREAWTVDERRRFTCEVLPNALHDAGAAQASEVAVSDPVATFVETLTMLFSTNRVRVVSKHEPLPQEHADGPTAIGWSDGDELLLVPTSMIACVSEALREVGERIPLKRATLLQRLVEEGLIVQTEKGRTDVKRKLGGAYQRVVALRAPDFGVTSALNYGGPSRFSGVLTPPTSPVLPKTGGFLGEEKKDTN